MAPPSSFPITSRSSPSFFSRPRAGRDFTLFFDAPHLLGSGWRLHAFGGSEEQVATPYYGAGNDAPSHDELEETFGQYYYRFGRTRRSLAVDVQRALGGSSVRLLVGAGIAKVTTDAHPEDASRTFLSDELAGAEPPGGWSNHVRAGIVWDSRDRESGPTRGVWTELLVQDVGEAFGSDWDYVRWTLTDRRYFALTPRLVLANRLVLQGVEGEAPFYDLHTIQGSFKQQEGLGGLRSVRGLPKNRYVGAGVFLWNVEFRWRATRFTALGRAMHLVLTGFVDAGRVWLDGVAADELLSDLHAGLGGGPKLGVGPNFVVSLDVGHSSQSAAALYLHVGYLF